MSNLACGNDRSNMDDHCGCTKCWYATEQRIAKGIKLAKEVIKMFGHPPLDKYREYVVLVGLAKAALEDK